MIKHLLNVSLVAVLVATLAPAQSPVQLKANIPFDFLAGTKLLKAGEYSVREAPTSGAIVIKGVEGAGGAILLANSATANSRGQARLVFHRYGDTYFLSEVWGPDQGGHQLLATPRERELAAQAAPAKRSVEVALR